MNKGEAVPGGRSAKKFSALFLSSFFFPPLLFAFTLSGQIMEKGAKTPLPGAALYLEAAGDMPTGSQPSTILPAPTPAPSYSAESDAKGRYQCALPAGKYRLAVAAEGYEKLEMPLLEIRGDQTQDFYLKREGFTLPEVVVSAEKAPKSQVSHETLSPEELTSVAGSVGDVMRAVQSLPGVINAGVEYDGLLVRGSGPDDNLYLVDRIPIGFPFHFGGAISTLDSSLLQGLDFITGNPGPAYANAQGGVVDVAQRDPRTDRWGFRADLNLLMSEAEVEGPLAPGWSVVFAGRRSYLDLLIGSLNSSTFTAVPVFEDYQVKAAYNPSPTRHWDFEALGSDDRVGVNVNGDAAAQDPALGGDFNFEDAYHSQGINYRDTTDPQNAFWNTLYHTQSWFDQSFGGGLYLDSTLEDFGDWFSWRHDFDKGAQLEAGLQYDYLINGTNAYFVVFPTESNEPFTATAATQLAADDTLASSDIGAYFNQKFKWLEDKLELSLGARVDYLTYRSQANWDPRFSAAYSITDQTTLKASYGWYHEAPSRIQGSTFLDPTLGNPQLGSEQSLSTVLGFEQKLGPGQLLRVEAYEKDLSQLIVSDPNLNYSNSGSGTARGVEFLLRQEPTDRLFGWISYSLSDSTRQASPASAAYPYDFSEPDILQVVAQYKINPGWDAGIKFLYSSGLPYTPVTGAAVTTGTSGGSPVTYYIPQTGAVNSQRLPDYVRLDVSTSLQTVYNTWEWRFYLEVLNALGNRDVLGYQYNAAYTTRSDVLDLSFLPYVGFEAKY